MHPLARHWVDSVVLASPVARALGVTVEEAAVDALTLHLPLGDGVTTTPGVVHGGVVATLIDIAGAAASASGLGPDEGATGGATSQLTVSYLTPARTDLRAVAAVVHRSRTSTHTQVRVEDAAGRLVALGQVASRIFH